MLDDAHEQKDGGEKVRLGMVVSLNLEIMKLAKADIDVGHSRKFGRHARGTGKNRWWKRRQRMKHNLEKALRAELQSGFMALRGL